MFDVDLTVDSIRSGGGGMTISSEAEADAECLGDGEGCFFWGLRPPKD